MADGEVRRVMAGFSLANRLLMYAGIALTPVQDRKGKEFWHSIPTIILLGYTFYQQYLWYIGAKTNQHHELSIFIPYFNIVYQITYPGGIPTVSKSAGAVVTLGTSAVLLLNLVSGWISILKNLPEGDGVYQFWFYGWRTLSKGWRVFFKLWMAGGTIGMVSTIMLCAWMGVFQHKIGEDAKGVLDTLEAWCLPSRWKSFIILAVSSVPLIVEIELTVKKNRIVSETDMVSVYLFVAQLAMLILFPFIKHPGNCRWPFANAKGRSTAPITTPATESAKSPSGLKGDSPPVNDGAIVTKELDREHEEV